MSLCEGRRSRSSLTNTQPLPHCALTFTVTDMLISILNVCSKEELDEEEEEEEASMALQEIGDDGEVLEGEEEEVSDERRAVVKQKILAVGRMSRVFGLLREEAERVSELKGASPTGKLPYGQLASGSEGIKESIENYDDARKADIENERVSRQRRSRMAPEEVTNADLLALPLYSSRPTSLMPMRQVWPVWRAAPSMRVAPLTLVDPSLLAHLATSLQAVQTPSALQEVALRPPATVVATAGTALWALPIPAPPRTDEGHWRRLCT